MKRIIKDILILLFGLFALFNNLPNIEAKTSTATVSVSSSSSKIVVGKTFKVTIKISSNTPLGSWDLFPSYNSNFKLVSGKSHIAESADNNKTKTKEYTYTFKAISTGSGKITIKPNFIYDFNENEIKGKNITVKSKTISVITQAQLEASYSKNNDLKSLSVDGLKLNPKFDDKTLNYKVEAGANTTSVTINAKAEDAKSKVSGTGKKKVSEGENKFKITVTAQNGSTKTYTIVVNVIDPNPIEVVINDQKYTIVKRESSLDKVEDFNNKTIKVNNQSIPALFNEENKITLVGLKDSEGDIKYFIYDEENNSYKEFNDITLSKIRILPLDMDKKINDYSNETITIDEVNVDALNVNNNIFIIKAKNLDTTEESYYYYDKDNNTIIKYYENEEEKPIIINNTNNENISAYKKIIMLLGVETVIIIFILICILIKKVRKNKRKREYLQKKIEEERNRKAEVFKLQSEIKELESKTSKIRARKKEVSKDESKKKK